MHSAVHEFHSDALRIAMPHPESRIVVRLGLTTGDGVDLHAIGARERVHRKHVRSGVRIAMTRLPLGSVAAVLGVSASAIAGKIVPLEDLWGPSARELRDRLATVREVSEATMLVEQAIAERVSVGARTDLARTAASKLVDANVKVVADELGISERQLRRVFRDAVGVGPKAFARLVRFNRALDAARRGDSWTRIAAATGYCDQAHLIDDFRAIAGTTPRALMHELAEAVA
jgi:AraC-like DNA-binding protein